MRAVVSVIAWTTGILGLALFLPPMILAMMLFKPKTQSACARPLMRLMLIFFMVRVRVRGLENVDRSRAHVFMANHASFFDLFMLGAYLPGTSRGIEAAEHFSWPMWGLMLKYSGMIPIDRSSAAASMRSMKKAAAKIGEGISILVLPEGTRSVTGRMQPFRRLPFLIPKTAGCDIVPIGLRGTFRVKRKTSWMLRPGRVEMIFGEPVVAKTVAENGLQELADLTYSRVAVLAGMEEREST